VSLRLKKNSAPGRERAQFCEQALHPLSHGIGSDGIGLGDLFAGIPIEFYLNQKVEFGVAEQAVRDTAMKKMAQLRMALHEVVFGCREDGSFLLRERPVNRTFSSRPFKELAFLAIQSSRKARRESGVFRQVAR
jgi:hypothetical protein